MALFARYTRDQKSDSPHDGVLVGREAQRTLIMDVLNPRSGPGAYLITGHRGAGKTSFITTCLQEYEDDVFTRFLNSRVGRALLWDRIGLALLGLCASAAIVVLFEVIALLTVQTLRLHSWLIISPVLILGFLPIIYGWLSVAAATSSLLIIGQRDDRKRKAVERNRRPLMHSAAACLLLVCAALLPLGRHAYGLALIFFAGSFSSALIGIILPLGRDPKSLSSTRNPSPPLGAPLLKYTCILGGVVLGWIFHWHIPAYQQQQPETIVLLILLGVAAFAIGTMAQTTLTFHIQPLHPELVLEVAERTHHRRTQAMGILLLLSIIGFGAWFYTGNNQHAPIIREYGLPVFLASLVLAVIIVRGIRNWERRRAPDHLLTEREPEPDWSRSTAILLFKGICAFSIGLQLLHFPLARLLDNRVGELVKAWLPESSLLNLEHVTFDTYTEYSWIAALFMLLALIYTIEYEWILIPFRRLRQDSAQRPHDLPAGEIRADTRRVAIRQASQTLPWQVLRFWLPVLVVSVNLGTDRLPYAEIVRAMLNAIRDRYALRFVSVRSGFALTVWLGAFGIMFLITAVLGNHLFWPRTSGQLDVAPPATDSTPLNNAGQHSSSKDLDISIGCPAHEINKLLTSADIGRICEAASQCVPNDYVKLPPAVRLGCSEARRDATEPISQSATLQILYFDLLQSPLGRQSQEDRKSAGYLSQSLHKHEGNLLLCRLLPCDPHADSDDPNASPDIPITHMVGHLLSQWQPEGEPWIISEIKSRYQVFSLDLLKSQKLNETEPQERNAASRALHFRGYHFLILMIMIALTRLISWLVPILPYRRNLTMIDEAIDRLTSRRVMAPPGAASTLASALNGILGRTQVQSKEIERENARTVETSFISIIESIQSTALPMLGASGRSISLAAPELVFLFDELDKVGVRFEPDIDRCSSDRAPSQSTPEPLDAERLRSVALHRLLSDMKSLLSSTPARFFFVGGRNLHDEWIADRTARLPLLSSIFKAEVYLPSFLADLPRDKPDEWLTRIHQYIRAQHARAKHEQLMGRIALLQPRTLMPHALDRATRFAAPPYDSYDAEHEWLLLHEVWGGRPLRGTFVRDLDGRDDHGSRSSDPGAMEEIRDHILQFLAYRSIGNPKRLRDILEAMICPTARLVDTRSTAINSRSTKSLSIHGMVQHSDHAINLSEPMRYRLQLISEIYGVLASSFASRYANRDDKLAVSLFNLADFLFRFHGRGFSWSNLERVDELVHVHRAHDHRQVLEDLVHCWSDRYLLQVLNGMYDFRFRSNIAREIEYLSRQSEEEMAAFNFTLDESEPLKALYKATFARMEGKQTPDALATLGELHEFDKEFDLARSYYQHAIELLDEIHRDLVGRGAVEAADAVWLAFDSKTLGLEGVRKHMTWGIHRLRLMLQIGMTFEISRNYERAAVEYRNARTLARALLRAMLDDEGRSKDETLPDSTDALGAGRPGSPGPSRRHLLKHMNLVFQPAFAEAWLAEKMPLGVDTSTTLIEAELQQIRQMLPFVREPFTPSRHRPLGGYDDGNLALVMAELHDKAGDLYFFKGRQVVEHSKTKRTDSGWEIDKRIYQQDQGQDTKHRGKTDGYQLRAHEHYSLALHEIRRFVRHRRDLSKEWNLRSNAAAGWDLPATVERGGWPDYVLRVAGSTLCDLAEGTLGRISFFGVLASIKALKPINMVQEPLESYGGSEIRRDIETGVTYFGLALRAWMESPEGDSPSTDLFVGTQGKYYALGKVEDWLGELPLKTAPRGAALRLDFATGHTDPQRLLFALYSNWVAANMLRQAGYTEDAAHEFMQIADAAAQLLWWATSTDKISENYRNLTQSEENEPREHWTHHLCDQWDTWKDTSEWDPFWNHIIDIGICSLHKAVGWFTKNRAELSSDPTHTKRHHGSLPTRLAVIGCSIGLAGRYERWSGESQHDRNNERREMLCKLMQDSVGGLWNSLSDSDDHSETPSDLAKAIAMKNRLSLLLKEIYLRYPYPMLTRLHALKIYIDHRTLDGDFRTEESGAKEEVTSASLHLERLANQFDADTLFTPFHVGFTLANAYLLTSKLPDKDPLGKGDDDALREHARTSLRKSEESVTMRRTHYESIERLYYLYDGFNDRDIHFNHALQMASLEVCLLLKNALEKHRSEWDRRDSGAASI